MAQVELIMPKMGESIMEATILKWLKQEGDTVDLDESVLEIATDKVDSEVPSPQAGVLVKILHEEGETIEVGKPVAIISTDGEVADVVVPEAPKAEEKPQEIIENEVKEAVAVHAPTPQPAAVATSNGMGQHSNGTANRFYSPLVMNIAKSEGISMTELENLPGSGKDGRVTKKDILYYVDNRGSAPATVAAPPVQKTSAPTAQPSVSVSGDVEIVEMDRMRKLIADHMVRSKQTSPHVTSFVEADVTNLVNWRNKVKNGFQEREGARITFTPLFVNAVTRAIKDYPGVNVSVDGDNIIYKKHINVGIAAALPNGNLIVPVIKDADYMNLVGLAKKTNDLVNRARENKLSPDEIQDGTFTLTNVGTFGNLAGTPIINQPQVAILATGSIVKKPAVLETEEGDVIAIRHMMMMSLSYDHRVVDGFLGGSFLRRVADYLEQWDPNTEI